MEDDDENYVEFGDDEGLDNIATPTSHLGADIPGSSGSSMLPPLSMTPKTPPMVGHPNEEGVSREHRREDGRDARQICRDSC